MDSLGGILLKGLLGNVILGNFNLGLLSVEVVEKPPFSRGGDGGGYGGHAPQRRHAQPQPTEKYVVITLRLEGKTHKKQFRVSETVARFTVKILETMNRVKEASIRVFVRKSSPVIESETVKPIVRIREDD